MPKKRFPSQPIVAWVGKEHCRAGTPPSRYAGATGFAILACGHIDNLDGGSRQNSARPCKYCSNPSKRVNKAHLATAIRKARKRAGTL